MLYPFQDKKPAISKDVYLADGVKVIGDVEIKDHSSVWFNSVLRADLAPILVGANTNIQDLSVIHVNRNQPTIIEDNVTIGHSVVLHACTIKKGSLIGMGSIILSGAEIGEYTLVAAGTLVPENKKFPSKVLLMGSPAKIIRELNLEELEMMKKTNESYINKGKEYLQVKKVDEL